MEQIVDTAKNVLNGGGNAAAAASAGKQGPVDMGDVTLANLSIVCITRPRHRPQ